MTKAKGRWQEKQQQELKTERALNDVRGAIRRACQVVPFSEIVQIVDEETGWTLDAVIAEIKEEEQS
jgi:hypothetical protein